ncbi:DNA/pantothenate metabolism flavoprotein [Paraphysoderma sedebokerense]|nr:DNA/pantothenate metabolism flavoprotein [Paraphysoderma sedebokerense]
MQGIGRNIEPHEYFLSHEPPKNLDEIAAKTKQFVKFHQNTNRKLVLITSGGTTVPLENQTVRFIDNFSAGTRGATSAEYFLEQGYAVVFLHRQFSLQPFTRNYTHSSKILLDLIQENEKGGIEVKPEYTAKLSTILRRYQQAKTDNTLLLLDFTTITEYLFMLRTCVQALSPLKERVMYYLAAAVSDFFIPKQKMAEHKIQSGDGTLNLSMDQVPKFLKPLVAEWANNGFIVSFKLETDPALLHSKSLQALHRYGHQIVIGNILSTRKRVVHLITNSENQIVELSKDQVDNAVEIESLIVPELVRRHEIWIAQKKEVK